MARLSHAQPKPGSGARSTRSKKPKGRFVGCSSQRNALELTIRQPLLEISAFLLFIIIPLALPVYWSSEFERHVVPFIRPYIPLQYQHHLPDTEASSAVGIAPTQWSPKQLLEACYKHQYTSEIISLDPLVIYINNFTSLQEAEELIKLG